MAVGQSNTNPCQQSKAKHLNLQTTKRQARHLCLNRLCQTNEELPWKMLRGRITQKKQCWKRSTRTTRRRRSSRRTGSWCRINWRTPDQWDHQVETDQGRLEENSRIIWGNKSYFCLGNAFSTFYRHNRASFCGVMSRRWQGIKNFLAQYGEQSWFTMSSSGS